MEEPGIALLCHRSRLPTGACGVTARLGCWMHAGPAAGCSAERGLWCRGGSGGHTRHVSAVMPSQFLAGVGGKYTSLRTIWLPHVERRAQPCRAGAGAACASAGARGQRRAQVPLPRFSLRFRPEAGVRCSPHPGTPSPRAAGRQGHRCGAVPARVAAGTRAFCPVPAQLGNSLFFYSQKTKMLPLFWAAV